MSTQSLEGSASPDGLGGKGLSRTPTSWDALDDILLMNLKDQQKLGWKDIASHFKNRTPNACQFRWRRLKSGNLKNPPKSSPSLGTPASGNSSPNPVKRPKKSKFETTNSGFTNTYAPLSNATFTGYDNNISNALAGLNALSNTPSNVSTPQANYQMSSNTNPSTPGGKSPNPPPVINTTNHPQHFDKSPEEVSLDPQSHTNAHSAGGGYYVDISIDPTMNLPHNQPHPEAHNINTPRNSSSGLPTNHLHNNSIIQIVRDDRNSISSTRASVSSLPSKSMNIPHHQLNNNALAHLPIIFGGNGSISGPSRNSSISGAAGIVQQASVPSLRNGSIVGTNSSGYYSRSGSVVVPFNTEKKEEKESKPPKTTAKKATDSKTKSSTPNPTLVLPWSMEEDELLINRRNRELSFAELSILLPQRTEGEIWSRIDQLENLRNGHRSSSRNRKRRQSSIGLDDVDDFYDEVDDVIGGIGDSEEDEDDVLVDVDDTISDSKLKKRRASSAVNPLSRRKVH